MFITVVPNQDDFAFGTFGNVIDILVFTLEKSFWHVEDRSH
jgi:hypothetical protein